jgi:hypothetical protein
MEKRKGRLSMIVILGFYRRKPEISHEEFCRIWSEEYGPLYDHPEVTRYLRRYVQHRISPMKDWPSRAVDFDGIAESWYENIEDRRAFQSSPYFVEVLKPVVARFLDAANSDFAAYDSPAFQIGAPPVLVTE